jgi:FtsP/CotA-like multicopper oxidase with cupredoxin domain
VSDPVLCSSLVVCLLTQSRDLKYVNAALNPNQSFAITKASGLSQSDAANAPDRDNITNLQQLSGKPDATMAASARQTIMVYAKTQILAKFSNEPKAFLNHTSWAAQTLPLLSLARSDWDDNQLVPFVPVSPDGQTWVDLVINNLDDSHHPFHLHGHSFYVLSQHRSGTREGWGSYDPFSSAGAAGPPEGLNLASPLCKDTVSVPRRGHVVVRFRADNPGLWMLHCHMLVHMGTGMGLVLHVGAAEDEGHVLALDPGAAALCGA